MRLPFVRNSRHELRHRVIDLYYGLAGGLAVTVVMLAVAST